MSKSKKPSRIPSPLRERSGGLLCWTRVRADTWLSLVVFLCLVEILTMLILLLSDPYQSYALQAPAILCGAKAADGFFFLMLCFITSCQQYGYDRLIPGTHPFHHIAINIATSLERHLKAWAGVLSIVLIAIPTALFTAVICLGPFAAPSILASRFFTSIEAALLIVFYLQQIIDWANYRRLFRPQQPGKTFRDYVRTLDYPA